MRGFVLLFLLVVVLLAVGYGLAELILLPFGGIGLVGGLLVGLLIVALVLGALTLIGRRRQRRAQAARAAPG